VNVLLETKVDEEPAAPAKVRRVRIQPWHAVTIAAPASACAAAQACKGKRYLSRDAPRLPLAGCDTTQCECKYRHFPDRRGQPRRHDEKGAAPQAREKNNRRISRGRRAVD
jgi:hypothetical protein